jgi:hypothetical protein
MEAEMKKDDVLLLFREKAATLGTIPATQDDIIVKLAELLANSQGYLSKDDFDDLVHIGAVMYQRGLSNFRAGTEVAATMRQSVQERKKK